MDQQEVQNLAQQFIDALHKLEGGDADTADEIVELFSDDAHLTNAALQLAGQEHTGREGIREFWREYRRTFGEIYSDFHHITTSSDAAGLFWTAKGTGNNGQPLQYDGVTLLVYGDDGKISRFQGYYDTRQLSREVGAEQRPTQGRV